MRSTVCTSAPRSASRPLLSETEADMVVGMIRCVVLLYSSMYVVGLKAARTAVALGTGKSRTEDHTRAQQRVKLELGSSCFNA